MIELEDNHNLIENIYTLFKGQLIGTIISMIGSIFIIRLISVEEYSLINISYIITIILISLGDFGLNPATTHFIAKKMNKNDIDGIRNIIRINLIIKIFIGLLFMFIIAVNANFIVNEIYKVDDERLIVLIQIASIGIFTTILFEAINSIFLGAEYMNLIRTGNILYNSLKVGLSVWLILLNLTLIGPLISFVFSPLIVALIYLFFLKKKFGKDISIKFQIDWKELKKMMKYGYPLLLVSLIMSIQAQIYSYILFSFGFLHEVSYFYVSLLSSGLIFIIILPISLALFPAFSKFEWIKNEEQKILKIYFQFSIKFGNLITLPIIIFIIIFSNEIFPIIYGNNYLSASPFISVYFLTYLLVPFGLLTIPAFLNGQKHTKSVMYLELIKLFGGISFGLIFIHIFGGIGIMIGIFIGQILSVVYGILLINRKYGRELLRNFKENVIIFLIATFGGIITFFLYNTIKIFISIEILLIKLIFLGGVFLFYIIFFYFIVGILNLINYDELNFLEKSFIKFPLISKIFLFFSNVEKKIINLRKKG